MIEQNSRTVTRGGKDSSTGMETRRRVLGEEHPSTLDTMNNLAFTMKAQDIYTEAIQLMSGCA